MERFLKGGFSFSVVAVGVPTSSGDGVCSTSGAGSSFGVAAEISTPPFDLGLCGLGVGIASVRFEMSQRVAF
jgi:hypothetical protein